MNHLSDENYRIPKGLRVYAVGDVHGHLSLLQEIDDAILSDVAGNPPEAAHIVYMGDYIDRGPDSRGVIDYLIARQKSDDGVGKTFLRGNHEDGMFAFMDDPYGQAWLKWGGIETLASYGVVFDEAASYARESERVARALMEAMPDEHAAFFDALVLSEVFGDYFFAHAGVDPVKGFDAQERKDLTRMRQPFLSWHQHSDYRPLEKRVVHGHTISKEPVVQPHRVGVDTGAYAHGVLTAGVFEGEHVRFLQVG